MSLYDITKTQKLMAETKTDKEISERLFEFCKHIVKELAEDFQLTDNEFQNLVDQMVELNMPHKPNPLQSWHEVETKVEDFSKGHFVTMPTTDSRSPSKVTKGIAQTGQVMNILKQSTIYNKILKSVQTLRQNEGRLKFRNDRRATVKVINEELIKQAIEGNYYYSYSKLINLF